MKIAVLISATGDFPETQIAQAINLARTLDASLTGIITSEQSFEYYPMVAGGMVDLVQDRITLAEKRVMACVEEFKSSCDAQGMAMEWYGKHGFIRQEWPELSPYFDLAIATSAFSAPELAGIGISATMQVTDETKIDGFNGRCVIAWDGSMPAGRAVRAALPLLPRFKEVGVITVDAKNRSLPTDIGSYLAANGIEADISSEVSGDETTATLILDQARGADLLVMGAYGSSMMIEKIFGGVTETVFSACSVPVLYAR